MKREEGAGKLMCPFKTSEDGVIEVKEIGGISLPIWINAEGNEIAYDPLVTHSRLSAARSEVKKSGERAAVLEGQLGGLEWVGDKPDETRAELEKFRATQRRATAKGKEGEGDGDGEGSDDAELEKLREANYQQTQEIETLKKNLDSSATELTDKSSQIQVLTVGAEFRRTAWCNPWTDDDGSQRKPKCRLEAHGAEALFGDHFHPNGDSVIATYTSRMKDVPVPTDIIYSATEPSKPAGFDEAFGILFNKWPQRSHYLSPGEPGGMRTGESGDVSGGGVSGTTSRAAFDKMSDVDRRTFLKGGGKVVEATPR